MRIAVQCQNIVPGRSGGIEHFAIQLVRALAALPGTEVCMTIPRSTEAEWRRRLEHAPAELREILSTTTLAVPDEGRRGVGMRTSVGAVAGRSRATRLLVRAARARLEQRVLKRIDADVVYYPFHRMDMAGAPAVMTPPHPPLLPPPPFPPPPPPPPPPHPPTPPPRAP